MLVINREIGGVIVGGTLELIPLNPILKYM